MRQPIQPRKPASPARRRFFASAAGFAAVALVPWAAQADEADFDAALWSLEKGRLRQQPWDWLAPPGDPMRLTETVGPAAEPTTPESSAQGDRESRNVAVVNEHTGELIDIVYREKGALVSAALDEVNRIFRDWRTGTVRKVDPALLDLLHQLQRTAGAALHLLSGYRTPQTNAMLARHHKGVAKHSLHIEARAADIYVPGADLQALWRQARALKGGGVGYYPNNGFIHVDTGRVRSWTLA